MGETLDGHVGLDLMVDAERTCVSHADGVTALGVKTGDVLWHTSGQSDRLLLSGDLLLATVWSNGDTISEGKHWVVARKRTRTDADPTWPGWFK